MESTFAGKTGAVKEMERQNRALVVPEPIAAGTGSELWR